MEAVYIRKIGDKLKENTIDGIQALSLFTLILYHCMIFIIIILHQINMQFNINRGGTVVDEFESQPLACEIVASDMRLSGGCAGYSAFFHHLQLASHDLAII